MNTLLVAALDWAAAGWNVFPLCDGKKGDDRGKIPRIANAHKKGDSACRGECGKDGHGSHDGTTDPARITDWWERWPRANIGANLGDDRLVFDIDVQHGGDYLAAFPPTRKHLTGRGGGNGHLIYRYEPGTLAAQIKPKNRGLGDGIDIKVTRGAYVVLPPSRHESGGIYLVVKPPRPEHLLSDEDVRAIYAQAGIPLPEVTGALPRPRTGDSATSGRGARPGGGTGQREAGTLVGLLARPAAEGGRNEWLTAVAGHYARDYRRGNRHDLFLMQVAAANRMLPKALPAAEVDKITRSIWDTELGGHPEREAAADSGWLVSAGDRIQCQVQIGKGDTKELALDNWSNFDLRAKQLTRDEDGRVTYICDLRQADPRTGLVVAREVIMPGRTLGDSRALNRWGGEYQAVIMPPENIHPKRGSAADRLALYLQAQCPPEIRQVGVLGWDPDALGTGAGGFITHEGVITTDGLVGAELAGVRADPHLRSKGGSAPHTYGFAKDEQEARRVLAEVLTFHEETACSVFGAWWAACLLKPQIEALTSLFPVAAVEAPSGSGKTNGFFDLMIRLAGNNRGEVQLTRASLRQHLAVHRSGIVWVDDMDHLDSIMELLRATTAGGTISKMAEDRVSTVNQQMVAPLAITGERLGLDGQKALRDRTVRLSVGSPVGRMSQHPGREDRPQWDDVLALRELYPDRTGGLSALAGWYVQWALRDADRVLAAVKTGKKVSVNSGRAADRDGVLWAGACLLDAMTATDEPGRVAAWRGDGLHAGRVRDWMHSDAGIEKEADNTLTREVLPWVLQAFHYPTEPQLAADRPAELDPGALTRHVDTPAFIHRGAIWFRAELVAEVWRLSRGTRGVSSGGAQRTETGPALAAQALALGGQSKQVWFRRGQSGAHRKRYYELPADYTEQVLGGVVLGDSRRGVRNGDNAGSEQGALDGL